MLALGMAAPLYLALAAPAPVAPVKPLTPGSTLPSQKPFKILQAGSGSEPAGLTDFDLDAAIKGKYLVLFYWVAGDAASERNLQDMARWSAGKKNLVLVGVVPVRGKTQTQVTQRLAALNVDIPVIWDEKYRIQRTVRAATVPHITVVDPERIARVVGAFNLKHKVMGDITLARYLTTALEGGGHPTITRLPRHYPVTELINGPYLDFTLNEVPDNKALRFADFIADGKLTLLVFWSPDCGHCKKEMPILNAFFRQHREALNIIGVVKVGNDGVRKRTMDFIRLNDLQFPTVADLEHKIFDEYRVRTTPTTVVVTPDGQVNTVLLGSAVDLKAELLPRIKKVRETAHAGA